MNVRPKNSTTKQFYWTFKQATEMTENITAMPHLHHIVVFHCVLMFQQLHYFWYMEKLNKHGGGKNVIILCTNFFMICISLSKKKSQKTKTKHPNPQPFAFLAWSKQGFILKIQDLRMTDLTWHSRSVGFGRVHWAVRVNSRIFANVD